MVCSYLVHSKIFSTAKDALSFYSEKRTKDLKVGQGCSYSLLAASLAVMADDFSLGSLRRVVEDMFWSAVFARACV